MANKTTQEPSSSDTTEVLVPSSENRVVVLGIEPRTLTYVQKPLSFFGKLEVFSILGSALDKAMSGPGGITIGELLQGPGSIDGELNSNNLRDADTFIKAIAKLVQYAPELLQDLYLVVLSVPRGERQLAVDFMERSEEEGGLSDEDGFGILETFVDQNWEVMIDFFTARIQPLFQKISSKVQESQPSKPLKTTRRTTQKA